MNKKQTSNNLKVAFFGTSDRSTPVLETLKINFDLKICITKSDVRVGRKQILKKSGVKTWAEQNNVPILEIGAVNSATWESVLDILKKNSIDYIIVADFSFIIPKTLINAFPESFINIHFSLLPKYRGASPVQYAILNGDEVTGITYQLIHEKVDHGDIINQVSYEIPRDDTAGEVYEDMFQIAAEELPRVLTAYTSGDLKPQKQDENEATYTYSKTNPKVTTIEKADAEINWDNSPTDIHNCVRAYNPWPIAWTSLMGLENGLTPTIKLKCHVDRALKVKIFRTSIDGGNIRIEELQVEGKNKMTWSDFVNGYVEK